MTSRERVAWLDWLVRVVGYPYNQTFDREPPVSRQEIAEAWARYEGAETVENYLQSIEWELGPEVQQAETREHLDAEATSHWECWKAAYEQGRKAGMEQAAKVMDDKADHCLQLAEDAPRKEAAWHTRRKEALMYEGAAAAIRAEP